MSSPPAKGKKHTVDHPVTSLLTLVQKSTAEVLTRVYHLQTLLFFIDRNWTILSDAGQEKIIDVLVDLLASDHPDLLVWSFLCLGAVVYCDCRAGSSPPAQAQTAFDRGHIQRKTSRWDPIWLHALRRVNAPIVCRAACHVAHNLLFYHRVNSVSSFSSPVTHARILSEIEGFVKDLDVQGPPYPSDSVCIFLARCLQIAGQDARLYRLHLEDKALVWLLQSWRAIGVMDREGLPLVLVKDIIYLLETICGFRKRAALVCTIYLPDCPIAKILVEEAQAHIVRNFQLDANLPGFIPQHPTMNPWVDDYGESDRTESVSPTRQLGSRERNVSTFLSRRLEEHTSEWNNAKDIANLRVEAIRTHMDSAVVYLLFQALLLTNGFRADSTSPGLKVITTIIRSLTGGAWDAKESALIAIALEPLITMEPPALAQCKPLLPPHAGMGVRADMLRHLDVVRSFEDKTARRTTCRKLLRRLWQAVSMQNCGTKS
jgi:serine-protein kinase ATM